MGITMRTEEIHTDVLHAAIADGNGWLHLHEEYEGVKSNYIASIRLVFI